MQAMQRLSSLITLLASSLPFLHFYRRQMPPACSALAALFSITTFGIQLRSPKMSQPSISYQRGVLNWEWERAGIAGSTSKSAFHLTRYRHATADLKRPLV